MILRCSLLDIQKKGSLPIQHVRFIDCFRDSATVRNGGITFQSVMS